LPESHATDWTAFELTGVRRVLVLSDVHVPYHDEVALNAALAHGDEFNPDAVLLNGDIADFYRVSRYQKDPDRRSFQQELDAVRQFLAHLRARFPRSRIVYKLGNHEERWWSYLWQRAPELMGVDFASFGVMVQAEQHRIELVSEQRPVQLGHLTVLHGHELPKGLTNPVNPARGAFLRALDIVLMGHQHRTSEHTETTMTGRTITCWSTGCLCSLTPEYMRINRHNHGFATVTMAENGMDFSVQNHRIRKGKLL
jgi:predicted phosphodiesterase